MERVSGARRVAVPLLVFLSLLIFLRLFYGILNAPDRPYSGLTLKENLIVSVAEDSPGEVAGLRNGDRIVQINGQPFVWTQGEDWLASLTPGNAIDLLIARGSEKLTLTFLTELPPASEIAWWLSLGFSGIVLLVFGLFVLYRRRDKTGLVFFLICYVFAFFTRPPLPEAIRVISSFERIAYDLVQVSLPALLLHFFLLFPEESSLLNRLPDRKARGLQGALYLPSLLIFTASQLFTSRESQGIVQSIVAVYFGVSILAALSLFVRSYKVSRLLQRKRLRVAILGTVGAILPVSLFTLVLNLSPATHVPAARYSYLFLLLLPVSFSYAIVRYRFLDIELILKKGILYSLLTAFLAAVYVSIVWGMGGLFRSWTGQRSLVLTVFSTLIIAVFFTPVRNRLQFLIDRVFFRDRYDYRKILKELSRSLAEPLGLESLGNLLVSRVPSSLKSEFAVLLVRKGKWFVVDKVRGNTRHIDKTFSLTEASVGSPGGSHEPLIIEKMSKERLSSLFPAEDIPILRASRASLLVPIYARGEPNLILLLGPRLSGEPYSLEDFELLSTVSEEACLSLENIMHAEERAEKEKMDAELRLAREIQMSLAPREAPQSESLEIFGTTIPSGKIGGDCLDFIRFSPSRIGIGVGDVSGKGVPAALLAAGVQAALRSEAERDPSPSSVLRSVNRRLLLLERPERFAGLVYAVFDSERSEIVYSNAGLNAPFLIRETGQVERLDVGGVILGISQEPTYHDDRMAMRPGDLVVFFTDGLVEQTAGAEEYGEERLLEVILRNKNLPAQYLAKAVLESIGLFSKEAHDDDMSIVVARALPII
ncbi:MAG: SpoIIE family protein phosphatase [Candidatus Eisenbacteria bacterium]|nr:SpoIIE family protein phosphatase [Candidatus Eisenbacteria bacterium]